MVSEFYIGITGHRHLPPGRLDILNAEIRLIYQNIATQHRAESIVVYSSLAEGADMLCAKLACNAGFRVFVPLPMKAIEYRKSFSETTATEFDCLLSLADQIFVVSPEEPIPPNVQQGFFYRQAGMFVAKNCDILLAIWNGIERDTIDGAGTWETIKMARGFGKAIKVIF